MALILFDILMFGAGCKMDHCGTDQEKLVELGVIGKKQQVLIGVISLTQLCI